LDVPPFGGDAMSFLVSPAQNLLKSLLETPQMVMARTCVNDAKFELGPDLIGEQHLSGRRRLCNEIWPHCDGNALSLESVHGLFLAA